MGLDGPADGSSGYSRYPELVVDARPFGGCSASRPALSRKIAARLEQGSDRISDLHLWRLGPGHLAAIISLVTHNPRSPDIYKRRLLGISGLSHVTIEVLTCPGEHH